MSNIKEVTIFLDGDISKKKTWSNVPYFLYKTLKNKGIIVNSVDVSDASIIKNKFIKILDRVFYKFLRIFINKDTAYSYKYTPLYQWNVNKIIKKGIKIFKNSDLFISISYLFNAKNKENIKTLMISDWTLSYLLAMQYKRVPDILEKILIKQQNKILKEADYVMTLFPNSSIFLKNELKKDIIFLGHVINTENIINESDLDTIIKDKYNSKNILFIGGGRCIPGAIELIKAVALLNTKYKNYKLDIVGLRREDFNITEISKNIYFYGYLDKDNLLASQLYYDLIKKAKVIINTTPGFGGFSAISEAMYYFTPVICNVNEEYLKMFSSSSISVQYCNNDYRKIADYIENIFSINFENFKIICKDAHEKVKNYTWDIITDKLLKCIGSS